MATERISKLKCVYKSNFHGFKEHLLIICWVFSIGPIYSLNSDRGAMP